VTGLLVLFPRHPADCSVCEGRGRVAWCTVRAGVDGREVADRLGTPTSCIPLPVLDVAWRADGPGGGDAA
jgi:hypothetical protein